MPSHVDLLAQTSPPPAVEPEVALYLHGVEAQPQDVQIVWRADLPEPLALEVAEEAISTVAVLPPVQLEAIALPILAARAFLREARGGDVSDIEGKSGTEEPAGGGMRRFALRWAGVGESAIVAPEDIRPGDTLIVPAAYGGVDRFGWHPCSREPVKDLGDEAAAAHRGVRTARIHPALLSRWFEGQTVSESTTAAQAALAETLERYRDGEDLVELCETLLERLLELNGLRSDVRALLEVLSGPRREFAYPAKRPTGILLRQRANAAEEFTDDDDASSLTREVLLEQHCEGVGKLAHSYAEGSGLSEALVADVALAGRLHDLGKADPRFQAWLRGGDRIGARRDGRLLAKSERMTGDDRLGIRRAREQAGYPEGGRHECYSVAMAQRNSNLLAAAQDRDLVLHLIGTHHGRGRPLFPAVEDEGMRELLFRFGGESIEYAGPHGLERLGSGWAEKFWQLARRYGYWGLAHLEALVRLADHRRSEEGY